jgi:aminoglycoside phosphotransferase (APT) family kinase protein
MALLASGRDSEIFEHGPGRVLRRARDGRSLADEAAVMRWVADHGFPVPRVFEADGPTIVMERVDGPTMIDDLVRHVWRLGDHARVLADLHRRLAEVPAPDWLRPSQFEGTGLLHLDLHPLNVLVTADGPVVIDWANASRGDPSAEVASTWMILATALPDTRLERVVSMVGRRLFLRGFLGDVDRQAARQWLPAMGVHRKADRNTTVREHALIDRLVARESRLLGSNS